MTIGLIGYGRFGLLAARYLAKRCAVIVYDQRRVRIRPGSSAVRPGSLSEAASQRIVILAVPISQMAPVLRLMKPHIRPGALVIDVCTVKVKPIAWMKSILPSSAYILGSHPMFGPDSDSGTLAGQQVILTPVRIPGRLLHKVTMVLRQERIKVTVMKADPHDRMIAETILLTHYIGRMIHGAGLTTSAHGTASYKRLLSIVDVAMNDTLQLLRDVWQFNPHTRHVVRALRTSERKLVRTLRKKGKD